MTIGHGLKFKMPPALSVDIKKRIVELRHKGLTICDIAAQMKVSNGGVWKTIRAHEECGEYLDPSKKRTGRPPVLNNDNA